MIIPYIAYVLSTGQITHIQTTPSDFPEEGTVIGDETIHHILRTFQDEVNVYEVDTFIDKFIWRDGAWFDRGVPASVYYYWADGAWTLNTPRILQEVRQDRNYRLGEGDWTQVADSVLTDEKKAEWATYRQVLRDYMSTVPADLTDPDNLVWPTKPS